jgi:hypothetical protein
MRNIVIFTRHELMKGKDITNSVGWRIFACKHPDYLEDLEVGGRIIK